MSNILDEIDKIKANYYESQGKNILFKKAQKMDCAKEICQKMNINDLFHRTIFIIPNTNKIVFDYNIFKLYANSDNYAIIIDYIISIYDIVLSSFQSFEIHVLFDSFSISAAERYKDVIQLFCNKCMNTNPNYSDLISKIFIYHTPIVIDSISKLLRPFFDKNLTERIVYYTKKESPELLQKLYNNNTL